MRRALSLLLSITLAVINLNAQVSAHVKRYNFGEINSASDRVLDVVFTNDGIENTFVLRTQAPREYTTLWSSRTIPADSSATLRIKFNPIKKGDYSDEIRVFFSSMEGPLEIRLTADVLELDLSDNPACPSFRDRAADCCGEEEFSVRVIDALTRKPINKARVRVIEQGVVQRDEATDRYGLYTEAIPIGFYLIEAQAEGYASADFSGYVNRRNNLVVLELVPFEDAAENSALANENEPEHSSDVISFESTDEAREVEAPAPTYDENLPENMYRPNSVVFLVDVSQSMAQQGKLELLKVSMMEMIGILRPIDQVALISYASKTVVVLDMTAADRKAELEKGIMELEAGGMTAGARGFKGAYEMAKEHLVTGGNNQVVVATDGAFTKTDRPKILKMARKYLKGNVKTSVIGIRSTEFASRTLSEISEAGKGSFIRVDNLDDALDSLVEEIKKQSRIVP